jgi:hypothetical protein
MICTTHTLRRLAQGTAAAFAAAALVVPTALASTSARHDDTDGWYRYAVSRTQPTDTDGWYRYALSPARSSESIRNVPADTDGWYRYAVSRTQPTDTDGWYRYALSHTNSQQAQGQTLITDTLGGNGYPQQAQGYRFITDTLAPGGGAPIEAAPSAPRFSWADAGVGAGTTLGALLVLLGGSLLVARRQGRLAN